MLQSGQLIKFFVDGQEVGGIVQGGEPVLWGGMKWFGVMFSPDPVTMDGVRNIVDLNTVVVQELRYSARDPERLLRQHKATGVWPKDSIISPARGDNWDWQLTSPQIAGTIVYVSADENGRTFEA